LLDNLISADKAAEMWKLSPGTVKNMCADGKVDAVKVGNVWVIDKRQPNPKQRGN